MVSTAEARKFALQFEESAEQPHFEVTSFRVKKKIFATLNLKENRACLKLNLVDQDVFSRVNNGIIFPVPNAYGKSGWTLVNLKKVRKSVFKDALTCAYCNVAPLKLGLLYKFQ